MTVRKVHSGARALVIGFDVGTTFSGVSYSILEPGQVPVIKSITRFPGQEHVSGDSKVPTAIWYDRDGMVRAEGAATTTGAYVDKAQDENWVHAKWFKLHLRPTRETPIHPLPHRKSATSVLADFLRYLFECTKTFIEQTHPNGRDLWLSLENSIQFVMAHPNGWEGKQQNQMRDAAIVAGLISTSEAEHDRLRFVTEGEASLHFCIQNGLGLDSIARGDGIVVVDAGGGTIDLSTYRMVNKSNGHREYEEISPPQCLFQGSIYVTERAKAYVAERLENSKYEADVEYIASIYDSGPKLSFDGEELASIKFGSARDHDPGLGIRSGAFKIPASDVRKFFEPSIAAVVAAVREQCISALGTRISSVFLVGGFAANDWLFSELKSRLAPLRLDLVRPDTHVNKAVADGAVSFHIDHYVSVRVARFTYGVVISEEYNKDKREHADRGAKRFRGLNGQELIPNSFNAILRRGVKVAETKVFRHHYIKRSTQLALLDHFSIDLYTYRGSGDPQWLDVEPELYEVICRIEGNTSAVRKYPIRRINVPNSEFYELDFEVVLSFGLTELKAQISWEENNVEKRGPAQILY
ncbi:hypothetical protein B0H17DRAFT_1101242 [Mycena rosella]|uniref:Actin-like ATPase domain-containing protein n=1 Tax=Mycena rosella TaxID=1033263 RepID=A0AAD7CM18_MYCRO|nr:hypothetical protein B0H17DRAFT_1101242 [Mycena rosella]